MPSSWREQYEAPGGEFVGAGQGFAAEEVVQASDVGWQRVRGKGVEVLALKTDVLARRRRLVNSN